MLNITACIWAKHNRFSFGQSDDYDHVPFILPNWDCYERHCSENDSVHSFVQLHLSNPQNFCIKWDLNITNLSKKLPYNKIQVLVFYFSEILFRF